MVGLGKFNIPFQCKCNDYSWGRRTFQPYWTCAHNCLGCYAKYGKRWRFFGQKSETPVAVEIDKAIKEYHKLDKFTEIEISSSCDPFDKIYEKKYRKTREFLTDVNKRLRDDVFFTFLTKSALIKEYIDVIPRELSAIQVTFESFGNKMKITSPKASTYDQRIEAVKTLIENDFLVGVRIDPIIPNFDTLKEIDNLIIDLDCLGIKHITISFIKLYGHTIKSISDKIGFDLKNKMYEKNKNEYFFKDNLRFSYAKHIRRKCDTLGLSFAMCREYLVGDTGLCDPFHIIPTYKRKNNNKNNFKRLTDF